MHSLVSVQGQGFNDPDCRKYGADFAPCAEAKIIQQCAAVKARNASIPCIFYYNAVHPSSSSTTAAHCK
jgi:hypothetical protein